MITATISTSAGPLTVTATAPAPGLLIFETPAGVSPMSEYRWILAHHEGAGLAAFQTSAEATAAAETVASLADWSGSAMAAAQEIGVGGSTGRLMVLLKAHGGQHPNT
ncbi:hypothetical protein ABT282_08495 [Streptomyces sp. NPDC000927]|uniref:hypothetical protein n=1 Tax=Streptomyces sp. NPDC000927 TaxID=3154371 RepID=UPI0033221A10